MRPLAIDTNLLVLLVVGLASKDFIAKHKRLREFAIADFELLATIIDAYSPIVVTQNVWTETSNLARYISEPARARVGAVMRHMMSNSEEAYVTSVSASAREEFLTLGLTDSAILELKPASIPILTADLNLYLAAQKAGRTVLNFNHVREANKE
jgi:hypothetical protein